MAFKLNTLKAILPGLKVRQGNDFIIQIGQIVDNSTNIQQLEFNVLSFFNRNGLNYKELVAQNSFLKADETNSKAEREIESMPIQNELIDVISQDEVIDTVSHKIDEKAEQFAKE